MCHTGMPVQNGNLGADQTTTAKAASVRKQLGTKNSKSNEGRQAKNGGVKGRDNEIRETIEASKSLKKVRRTHSLGKNRMITLLDKQGREIQEQDKIMERIEEFYSELYDSDQAVTIQTDPEEVPPIMAWEVEAALRKMKNGKEAGKDQVNIETLKAGDETIAKQLAKLYTKCITERHIPKTWKEANMVIFFKKGNRKDIKNYRPICLQTVHKNHNN